MKRCPQCEFIYEDDQNVCDMDGIGLVFDATPLPRLQAVTDPATDFVPGANWRNHILPVIAATILGTVLFLVYYVSTHPLGSGGANITTGSSTTIQQSVPTNAAGPTQPATPPPANSHSEKASVAGDMERDAKKDSSEDAKISADPKASSGAPSATPDDAPVVQPGKIDADPTKKPTNGLPRSQGSAPRRYREVQKKDSKIASFFKKTGNVLKKPFSH